MYTDVNVSQSRLIYTILLDENTSTNFPPTCTWIKYSGGGGGGGTAVLYDCQLNTANNNRENWLSGEPCYRMYVKHTRTLL